MQLCYFDTRCDPSRHPVTRQRADTSLTFDTELVASATQAITRMVKTTDAAVDAWIREHDPEADSFPRPDEGRSGREVHFDASLLAEDLAEMDRIPLPELPEGLLCSHCHLEVVKIRRAERVGRIFTDLGHRCYTHLRRRNELPSARSNETYRKRLGIDQDFLYMTQG